MAPANQAARPSGRATERELKVLYWETVGLYLRLLGDYKTKDQEPPVWLVEAASDLFNLPARSSANE